MNKIVILIATACIFAYGVAVGNYQIFPFTYIAATKIFVADNLNRKQLPNVVQPSVETDDVYEFVFLGNSLTHHSPNFDIGWNKNHGMAASNLEKDFVHQFMSLINNDSAYIANMYPIERDISDLDSVISRVRPAFENAGVVVIQLGDNTNEAHEEELEALKISIDELGKLIKPNQLLLCVSTYWRNRVKDRIIEESCENNSGQYVFIGDIFDYQTSEDLPFFTHAGVNMHPKDPQMLLIAKRIRATMIQAIGY